MTNHADIEFIRQHIRTIENWPEPGVQFRDITTLLQNPKAFQKTIDILVERYKKLHIEVVAGLDARGFIFGPIVAYALGIGFIPIRKKGKLPYKTYQECYSLEYGEKTCVEIHIDAVQKDQRVLIIDDLIATGGTMLAACKLIQRLGGVVVECAVINNLLYLKGAEKIKAAGFSVYAILDYEAAPPRRVMPGSTNG